MSSILEQSAQFNRMTDLIVRDRLKEICPDEHIQDLSISELKEDCNVAFKIIGYEPKNLDETVDKVYMDYDFENLYEFIFKVWEMDK